MADFVDLDDEGVFEPRGAAGLSQEAFLLFRCREVTSTGYLNGCKPIQIGIMSLVHRTERPATEQLQHLEPAYLLRQFQVVARRGAWSDLKRTAAVQASHLLLLRVHQLNVVSAVGALDVNCS